ncbi:uncharacterized protein LOC127738903 isoform X2 [Mytilus californianus]|uniref:uncharacterized protein LOC127738903 isoform X2 n=1 Tax=Mytilus californianus TaxID=6549 RepID=UPI0022484995|nr:uncharacterized protein LOC127738903 isoform X2 [Mytilus californianus]
MDFNFLRDLFILVCTMGFFKWIIGLKLLLDNFFSRILSVYCLSINGKNTLCVKPLKNCVPKRCLSGRNDTLRLGHHLLRIQVYIFSLDLYINRRPYLSFHAKMRFEWARLESFYTAPNTLGVSTIKLANAGFYYTGVGHNCRCTFCGFSYQNWNNGDNPKMIHRRFQPDCPFLVSTLIAVNIPISELERRRSPVFSIRDQVERTPVTHNGYVSSFQPSRTEDGHTETDIANLFHNLLEVIEGFQNQTHVTTLSQQNSRENQGSNSADNPLNNQPSPSISSSNLTESTLQELTEGQEPIILNGEEHELIIPNGEEHELIIPNGEEPELIIPNGEEHELIIPNGEEHKLMIPNGEEQEPIIPNGEQQEPTIPNGEEQEPRIPNDEEQEPLNNLILQNNSKNIADIKYPEYIPFWKRRASFKNLPLDQTFFSLSEFAKSGFYYSKIDDCMRCFHCGIGLRDWEADDSPWFEHARWSRKCPYLQQKKGKGFVDAVHLAITKFERQEDNTSTETVSKSESSNTDNYPPTTQQSTSIISPTFTESQQQVLGEDQESSLGNNEVRFQDYKLLETRRASFKNWPADRQFLCPIDLAECVFFYTNFGDCVRCFYCGIGLRNWETDDISWIEHARWSGKCPYLLQKKGKDCVDDIAVLERQEANIITEISSNSESSNTDNYPPTSQPSTSIISPTFTESQLQVLEDQEPSLGNDEVRFPDYKNLETRKASFKNWPANRTFLSPFDLAECGFFYTQMDDCVRCFHCGIGFKEWGPADSPWYEHARCSEECPYILQMRGKEFVDLAHEIEDLERQSANARR